ncbi:chymotrypsin-1-like [Ochlerotatus camptorhynchus]|uniref:chymotrypsin-1-like n=1 Tax=Ochlerotatus camptorhynchus TaxID=644619 RepID=UPI0031D1AE09
MFRYLLIVGLACSALANEAQSGRIVGGLKAGGGQFPFQASLRNLRNAHTCGAVIIGDRWLLTAAHCTIGQQPFNLRVVVGSTDRTTGGESYNFRQIVDHPDFNQVTLENDIALLQTAYPIKMSSMVQPIRMSNSLVLGGQIGTVCGWGASSYGSAAAIFLQYMDVRTLNNGECKLKHNIQNRSKIHGSSVCTYSRVGQGTCMGDSGSPLIVNGNLEGLVSWGVPCAAGLPDVYTRVAAHRAWIFRTTGL